jgi:hypothetical protein
MKKLYAAAYLLIGLSALPAFAIDSAGLKTAMTKLGLIGEWAAHCSQPPSGNNAHTHWSASSETAGELFTDFGGGQTMSYDANFAELVGANRIRIRLMDNRDKTHLELIIEKRDGQVRTLSSVGSDGRALIDDGKFVSNGTETVAQERCN